ncbi:class I SAM-dependent methyltransferase [Halobaculum sp. MBLA0143]|uniref:class I SAM-dependent methyltransferase n=1 Tax=Halobaculum sp. MBLA0143 TaxID=3079933 RepID=UPI0035237C2C
MFDYYFGIARARRRGRRIAVGLAVAAVAAGGGAAVASDTGYVVGLAGVVAGTWYAQPAAKRLLVPAPWSPERWKYAPLAEGVDWDGVDHWLDLGTGTGRSLVGPAPAVDDARVTALDPFDGGVIAGGPERARRNAATAGLDARLVRGDTTRLPFTADSADAVTACGLLHDHSRADAEATLAEARRVLRPAGTLGVIESVATHEETDDPLGYWSDLVVDAGFEVTASGTVERRDSTYHYVIAAPA